MRAKFFLIGFFIGILGFIMQTILLHFVSLEGGKSWIIIATFSMSVANIGSALLSVLVFNGGMFGIALSSSIGFYAGLLVLVVYFVRGKTILHFKMKGLSWNGALHALYIGVPSAVSHISRAIRNYGINMILMGIAGSLAVSAFSVYDTWSGLVGCVGSGVSTVIGMLSGIFYGERNRGALVTTIKHGYLVSFVAMACGVAITIVFAPWIVEIFIKDENPETLEFFVLAMRILSLQLLTLSFVNVFQKYTIGIRKIAASNMLSILPVVYQLILAYLLSRVFGVIGVWVSFVLAFALTVATMLVVAKIRTGSIFYLAKEDSIPLDQTLNCHLSGMDELVPTIDAVTEFCRERGVSRRNTYLLGLCVEEMARNSIQHGFRENRKSQVSVRLVLDGGNLILRIRDNCPTFNPEDYFAGIGSQDEFSNFGIRMVFSLADDIRYVPLMKMNNLVITVPNFNE